MNTTLRWSARALSIFAIAILVMFALGQGLNFARFSGRDLFLFVFFPLGLCVGMVIAWWREGLGACIALGSLAAFYLADRLLSSSFPRGVAFVVLAVPGFLFLLSALRTRSAKQLNSH